MSSRLLKVTAWLALGCLSLTAFGFLREIDYFLQRAQGMTCNDLGWADCGYPRPFLALRIASVAVGIGVLALCLFRARRNRREQGDQARNPEETHFRRPAQAGTRAALAGGLGFLLAVQFVPVVYSPIGELECEVVYEQEGKGFWTDGRCFRYPLDREECFSLEGRSRYFWDEKSRECMEFVL